MGHEAGASGRLMDIDALLLLACKLLGLSGLALLGVSAATGVVRASPRTRRSSRVTGAVAHLSHRRWAILGTTLLLLHPLPALAVGRTGLDPISATVPFAVPEQTLAVAAGIAGLWTLLIVAGSSCRPARRRLGRGWRRVHYAAYPALALGVAHAVLMVGGYPASPAVDPSAPEKLAIEIPSAVLALLVVSRVAGACLRAGRGPGTLERREPASSGSPRLTAMLEESTRQRWRRQRIESGSELQADLAALRQELRGRSAVARRQWQGYEPESVNVPVPAAGMNSQE
jgi:DMSO/TMAO reductase YedYZ heme-binding membrane subunit